MNPKYFIKENEELLNKKVLIASPFYEWKGYCTNAYFENIKDIDWDDKDYFFVDTSSNEDFMNATKDWCDLEFNFKPTFFHVPFVKTSRKRQVFAYNKIREYFLKGDYDYLFIVESDLFPHKYILKLLMRWNVDVVGGLYCIGANINMNLPCCTTDAQNLQRGKFGDNFLSPRLIDGSLRVVKGGIGFGCCLIKRKVLEQIKFRSDVLHADTYFHQDCEKFGFKRYIDTSQMILHDPSDYYDF